jgi:O-antigen/teichoic acid export membrane protein
MLKQVARNTAVGLVGNVVGLGLQFVAAIIVARGLGAERFGVYSSALAFALLFGTLADGGVSGGLARELAVADASTAQRLFGAGLLIKVGASLLAYALLAGAALLLGFAGEQLSVILVMGLAYLWSFLGQTAVAVVRARGRMEVEAGLTALYSAVFATWVLLVPHSPIAFAWGWVVAYTLYAVVGLSVVCWRFVRPVWNLDSVLVRQIWWVGLPLGLAALLLLIYTRLPIYMLTALSSPSQVGLFNAAFGLVRNLQVVAFTLSGALSPVFVQLATSDTQRLSAAYTVALRTTLLLLLPVVVSGTVLSGPIILMLLGPAYAISAPVLAMGVWSLCFYTLSFVAQTLLVAQGRGARWFMALAAGLLLDGALALLLAPRLGAVGASSAAVAADLLILTLLLSWTRPMINIHKLLNVLPRIGASVIGMALVAWLLRRMPGWVSVPTAACVYIALLLLLGAVLPAELIRAVMLLPLPTALRIRIQRLAL